MRGSVVFGWLVVPVVLLAIPQAIRAAPTIVRVSAAADGTAGDDISGQWGLAISSDGRYVAFGSSATNLVPNDKNGSSDVFVRDLLKGTIQRVSVANNGAEGNNGSSSPSLSADGRYVAFISSATNLVSGDPGGWDDVYVRDTEAGTTARVSVASDGSPANGNCFTVAMSPDGRYVVFDSGATNLTPDGGNGKAQIFLRDLTTGTTKLVSVTAGGAPGDDDSREPYLSPNGRYVSFTSSATNLAPGDTNKKDDVFLKDMVTGALTRASVAKDGTEGNDNSDTDNAGGAASVTADGRYVVFESNASNLVPNDTNTHSDAFMKDTVTGTVTRVSVASDGTQGTGGSYDISISPDGRYAVFQSYSGNLVTGDTNGASDIFIRDLAAGTIQRVSIAFDGKEGDGDSAIPVISADGRYVAFASQTSNLVSVQPNTYTDVYWRGPLFDAPFTLADVGIALRIAGGGTSPQGWDSVRLDVASPAGVNMKDAIVIARKVAGLIPNP